MMYAGETIVAVYDGFENANAVLQALLDEGFLYSDVSLAVSNPNDEYSKLDSRFKAFETIDADEENGFGALLASLAGTTFGLKSMTIPGMGPIVAAGPLADVLADSTNAVIGGAIASLVHLGIPHYEAGYYAEALASGYALISVHIRTEKATTIALDVLRHNHPKTIKTRTDQWMGFDMQTASAAYNDLVAIPEAIARFPYVRLSMS